jgi:hypothetical protein
MGKRELRGEGTHLPEAGSPGRARQGEVDRPAPLLVASALKSQEGTIVRMRRLVAGVLAGLTGLGIVVVLTACSAGAATEGTASAATATVVPASAGAVVATSDQLSPTETVVPYEQFPTSTVSAPPKVQADLDAHQPMLIFVYDPTTLASNDERVEIDAVMEKYRGMIDLITYDYTSGLSASQVSSETTASRDVQKAATMTGTLGIKTTPYVLFVDRYGRITYRFAGFADQGLIEREAQRATQ